MSILMKMFIKYLFLLAQTTSCIIVIVLMGFLEKTVKMMNADFVIRMQSVKKANAFAKMDIKVMEKFVSEKVCVTLTTLV